MSSHYSQANQTQGVLNKYNLETFTVMVTKQESAHWVEAEEV